LSNLSSEDELAFTMCI